ncbi:hypothetical protein [Loktanella salsilacus]|uniref:hypothetical protein n=1 Tax=Loktanella salsilacus TaxID=195913 RepID=UPI0037359F6A
MTKFYRNSWEFDAIEFLREMFANVGIAMPSFSGNVELWKNLYVTCYGFNVIAETINDRVEVSVTYSQDDKVKYSIRTRALNSFEVYRPILHMAFDGVYTPILSGASLPPGDDLSGRMSMKQHQDAFEFLGELAKRQISNEIPQAAATGEILMPADVTIGRLVGRTQTGKS